ncbi:MAG TPA: DUF1365 family protein [Caulobacteraceae bacterium]|nr:DUF1365 family protein [Caulobacteraceae bacterium]
MIFSSGLYEGLVVHQRLRPQRHRLRYRIFQLLLDLDELDALDERLRLFGHNRSALISFYDRDHGPGDGRPLRPYIERELERAGVDLAGGRIRVLCMPRVLGQVFNPLTLYFCWRRSGRLVAIIYEVNNTFGQRHSYLIPIDRPAGEVVRQSCDKAFYVSPLQDMAMRYDFTVRPPGAELFVAVGSSDDVGPMLHAAFSARRSELTDGAILKAFLGAPLLMLKVMAGIHWEALRTWLKGARFHPRPPAPAAPVTVVSRSVRRAA